jgi:hypothetical protein
VNKLDEIRRQISQQQHERASNEAAQDAMADAALEVAIREDLPKWVALLEAAVNRKVSTNMMELVFIAGTRGGLFTAGKPDRHLVQVWPSIDVNRVRGPKRFHMYAAAITKQLGEPFKLTFNERREDPNYFTLTW